jgi:hypothetical protein
MYFITDDGDQLVALGFLDGFHLLLFGLEVDLFILQKLFNLSIVRIL